ncbi:MULTISPECIES: EAL and HDOD domain-containing protein [unclassified Clostridium]|uniref:EAL and HDOD domain-containing protein n=1 Tax=unclassified Clostridium TaxID=2614128 RepID=UPI002A805A02|nr:HDOD domain-containing protein [Clostridium sp.]MDY4253184.1 EAL domain-containing protein [Clostridium sp.]
MDIFIARQGIYDKNGKVVAYELLYRNSMKNSYNPLVEDDVSTYKVIENISSFGLDILTNKKRAFVNFSEALIMKDIATLLPKENVVIEVLETVNPSEEIINKLLSLKDLGYYIALDDVVEVEHIVKFIGVIDIVKVDFRLATSEARKKIAYICNKYNIDMLAEKVETSEELNEAKELGYIYFQGYYYSKPSIFLGKDIAVKNTSIFMLLVELIKENYDIDKVEYIMKTDVALTYKFLKFINSSYFNFLQEIKSIRQAIILIGREELRKWLSILTVVEMSSINSGYANSIIIRAKFCEEISNIISSNYAPQAFMVGLFSNMHQMIEKNIDYVVKELPLNSEIKNALLGEQNVLKDILDLALAYENVDSDKITEMRKKMSINEDLLWRIYSKSIERCSNIDN